MRAREFILLEVSDRVKQQVTIRFKKEDPNLTDQQIKYYLDHWDRFVNNFPANKRDLMRLPFREVEQMIDAAMAKQALKGRAQPQSIRDKSDALYNKNNLEIYKGDLPEKCIRYGQGYTWCISRADANNLFYSYRMRANEPMFYFVFDLDRPKEDPWHAVVIYVDQAMRYHVALATNPGDKEMTWEQIVSKHPKLRNLKNLFQPQPLTDTERSDYEKYGIERSLEQYQQLDLQEKLKYIMFGNLLTPEQQTVTPDQLISVYAKQLPTRITKETWHRLNPGDQKYIEKNQMIAVQQDGEAIGYILDAGIRPSEEMQMAAVQQNGHAIGYILDAGIRPSEEMQMAAVQQNGQAIGDIIRGGIRPSEEMMMKAVQQNGLAIGHILGAGIQPSEEMQMTAVQQNGHAIGDIIRGGIQPSEEMMMKAVQQNGHAIGYILRAGIQPSEAVQMAAVQQNGEVIKHILRAGIQPSEAVRQASARNNQ
jgi:ribosomal protein S16